MDDHPSGLGGTPEVRRALLAVCVLDGVDVLPTDAGIQLGLEASSAPVLPWEAAQQVLGQHSAGSPAARPRLRSWLLLHCALRQGGTVTGRDMTDGDMTVDDGDPGNAAPSDVTSPRSLRVLALQPGSALHPGPVWVRERVLGGALDLGLGIVGHLAGEEHTVPLWPDVAEAAGFGGEHADGAWVTARAHLETMARIAVRRLQREAPDTTGGDASRAGRARHAGVLRPVGGCDVPTLLASPHVRAWISRTDGVRIGSVAVPTRSRGWTDVAYTDPAFVAAAWMATDVESQGLPRPVLVSDEEVAMTPALAG